MTVGETELGRVQAREILRLAIPALGALLAEPLFLLVDTAIVGHLGARPLAGFGTASVALATLVNVCIFLAYGTTAAASRKLGAGDTSGAIRMGIDGVALAAGLGIVLALIGIAGAPWIMRALGAPSATIGFATTYLRVSALGLPSMLVVLAATGLLRGLARIRVTVVIAASGAVVNAALNYLLVYPAGLGIAGSALGTALTQTLMAGFYLESVYRTAHLHGVSLRPRLHGIRESLKPHAYLLIRAVSIRIYLLVAVWVAGSLGTTALGAHTIAANLWNFLAMALDALAIAAQTLIGHALGSGDAARSRYLLKRLTRWGVGYGVVTGGLLLAVVPLALPLLTPDAHVREELSAVIVVMALFQPLAGAVFVLDGVLIGAGDFRYLAWAGLACTAVFVVFALPVSWVPLSLVDLWWAIGIFMIARLVALGLRARGSAWLDSALGIFA